MSTESSAGAAATFDRPNAFLCDLGRHWRWWDHRVNAWLSMIALVGVTGTLAAAFMVLARKGIRIGLGHFPKRLPRNRSDLRLPGISSNGGCLEG